MHSQLEMAHSNASHAEPAKRGLGKCSARGFLVLMTTTMMMIWRPLGTTLLVGFEIKGRDRRERETV